MANNNKEFEIQGNVEHIDALLKYLEDNANFKGKSHILDEYFVPQHRNFLDTKPVEEWLRLRNSEGKQSITYKRWHYNDKGEGLFADEYESQVEDIGQIKKIFETLQFKSILVLDKERKVWECGEYEIAIDDTKGIEEPMVEVEYSGTMDDYETVNSEMVSFLKKTGSGRIRLNYSGIPIIMLFPDEVKYVEV